MAEARRHLRSLLFPPSPNSSSFRCRSTVSTPPSDEFSFSTQVYFIFSPPVRHVVFLVFMATLFFFYLLVIAIRIRYLFLPTPLPSAAAQLEYTPQSDEFSSSIVGNASMDTAAALASFGFIFIFWFYLAICATLHPALLIDPEDSIDGAVRPLERAPRGLDPAVTKTFPTIVYSAEKGHKIGNASLECAVCLNDFEDDEMVCLIPKCDHAFHPNCIGKWLASHTTCPLCPANLALQPAFHWASQLAESVAEPPWVEVKVEVAPPDDGMLERSPREGGRERIQPPDLWDKNESGSFDNCNQTRGSGRIQKFPRSHSTGHSPIRKSKDTERFTLRLPAELRKQLMDRPGQVLPLEPCSRQGYRCGGEESSQGRYFRMPDRLDRAAKSEGWAFNRISPRVAADSGGGSSRGLAQWV